MPLPFSLPRHTSPLDAKKRPIKERDDLYYFVCISLIAVER